MTRGETRYAPLSGTSELRAAICAKFAKDNRLHFAGDEVTVAAGAKQILFNAFMASLNPGDEVILQAPYWTSYVDLISIYGGRPLILPCSGDNGFRMTATQLEQAITEKTRWVLFNSPSNPSGACYSPAHYRPLIDVLLRHPYVWVMSDDIYEHIVYDNLPFTTPAALEPALRDRCLTVNGVSKAYAMTGWRLGYCGGPRDLTKAMAVVQSNSTSAPSSISQAAALAGRSPKWKNGERPFSGGGT